MVRARSLARSLKFFFFGMGSLFFVLWGRGGGGHLPPLWPFGAVSFVVPPLLSTHGGAPSRCLFYGNFWAFSLRAGELTDALLSEHREAHKQQRASPFFSVAASSASSVSSSFRRCSARLVSSRFFGFGAACFRPARGI